MWWRFVLQDVGLGARSSAWSSGCVGSRAPARRPTSIPADQKSLYALGVAFADLRRRRRRRRRQRLHRRLRRRDRARHPPAGHPALLRERVAATSSSWSSSACSWSSARCSPSTGSSATAGRRWRSSPSRCSSRARSRSVVALAGTRAGHGDARRFMAWFGPKGVATMTFSLLVLSKEIAEAGRIFNLAALAVFCSIIAHGLTDTPGANWLARRAAAGAAARRAARPAPGRSGRPRRLGCGAPARTRSAAGAAGAAVLGVVGPEGGAGLVARSSAHSRLRRKKQSSQVTLRRLPAVPSAPSPLSTARRLRTAAHPSSVGEAAASAGSANRRKICEGREEAGKSALFHHSRAKRAGLSVPFLASPGARPAVRHVPRRPRLPRGRRADGRAARAARMRGRVPGGADLLRAARAQHRPPRAGAARRRRLPRRLRRRPRTRSSRPSGPACTWSATATSGSTRQDPAQLAQGAAVGARTSTWPRSSSTSSATTRSAGATRARTGPTVAYHHECHMLRGLGEARQPLSLLRGVEGCDARRARAAPTSAAASAGPSRSSSPTSPTAMADEKLDRAVAAGARRDRFDRRRLPDAPRGPRAAPRAGHARPSPRRPARAAGVVCERGATMSGRVLHPPEARPRRRRSPSTSTARPATGRPTAPQATHAGRLGGLARPRAGEVRADAVRHLPELLERLRGAREGDRRPRPPRRHRPRRRASSSSSAASAARARSRRPSR